MTIDNFNWFIHVMLFLHTKHVIRKQELRENQVEIAEIIDSEEEEEEED